MVSIRKIITKIMSVKKKIIIIIINKKMIEKAD